MKITIEPTEQFFHTDEGYPVRAWTGSTDLGTNIIAFISAIAVRDDQDASQLEAELKEIPGPVTPDAATWLNALQNVLVFQNGQILVFDAFGRQVRELQGRDTPELRSRIMAYCDSETSWIENCVWPGAESGQ